MNKKIYKFSYGGNFKKFLSKFLSLIYNIFVGLFVLLILAFIVSEINYLLSNLINDSIINFCKRIEVYSGILVLGYFIVPSFFPQKVEMTDNIIKVKRHCLFLSVFMIFRGFNDTILISQIEKIYRPTNKDKFFEPIPVNVIDWDNMIIIETQLRDYYIPVEHSNDFINEVNKRIQVHKGNDSLS